MSRLWRWLCIIGVSCVTFRELLSEMSRPKSELSAKILAILIVYGISVTLIQRIHFSGVDAAYGEDCCFDRNAEIISKIHPESWACLSSLHERTEVLQAIIRCEGRYLGFQKKVHLKIRNLENAVGTQQGHTIELDESHVMNAGGYEVLDTVLHECWHVYQEDVLCLYQSVDPRSRSLLMFQDARIFEQDEGKKPKDHIAYLKLSYERHANRMAVVQGEEYASRIEAYRKEKASADC